MGLLFLGPGLGEPGWFSNPLGQAAEAVGAGPGALGPRKGLAEPLRSQPSQRPRPGVSGARLGQTRQPGQRGLVLCPKHQLDLFTPRVYTRRRQQNSCKPGRTGFRGHGSVAPVAHAKIFERCQMSTWPGCLRSSRVPTAPRFRTFYGSRLPWTQREAFNCACRT